MDLKAERKAIKLNSDKIKAEKLQLIEVDALFLSVDGILNKL